MSAGKLIADGSMIEHRANEQVVDAYLGALDTQNRPGHKRVAQS
jgi:ABC-type uncharacterized transport system ATPase subunit